MEGEAKEHQHRGLKMFEVRRRDPIARDRRKIQHPQKSTQNKEVQLNKFLWTISAGFLTHIIGKQGWQAEVRSNLSKKLV